MSDIDKRTHGLLLEREFRYGTEYVIVRVVVREQGQEHPLGCNDSPWSLPKHLQGLYLDGLGMSGFVSDDRKDAFPFIGHDVEFRNVFAINESAARRMLKTLAKVNREIDKRKAYEPGDKLIALASALKLAFVVEKVGTRHGSNFSDQDWRFMSIEEGRNRYRALIEEAQRELAERRAA